MATPPTLSSSSHYMNFWTPHLRFFALATCLIFIYPRLANASSNAPFISEGNSVTVTMDEDGIFTAPTITANDLDGDPLTWSLSGNGVFGEVTSLSHAGNQITSLIYTPDVHFNGYDEFELQVSDDNNGTANITVNVIITAVNDNPVVQSTPITLATEDNLYIYTLIADDLDAGDNLVWNIKGGTSLPDWLSFETGSLKETLLGTGANIFTGVTTDDNGNIYYAEDTGVTIYKIDADANQISWATVSDSEKNGLLVVDNFLYISYYYLNKITRIDLSDPDSRENDWVTNIDAPVAMASRDGLMYVCLPNAQMITYIDMTTLAVSGNISASYPSGLDFDSSGNLYYTEMSNGNVVKYDGTISQTIFSTPNYLTGIKIDANDQIHLSCLDGPILKLNSNYGLQASIGSANSMVVGLSFTSHGNLVWSSIEDAHYGNLYLLDIGRGLTGTPSNDDVGTHSIYLTVSDGNVTIDHNFLITVLNTNDSPILTSSTNLNYTENGGAVILDAGITLMDIDADEIIESASVMISGNFKTGEDRLAMTDTNSISASWESSTGLLTLSGNASVSAYQSALASVTYENLSDNPNTEERVISWNVNDGDVTSQTLITRLEINAINDAPIISGNDSISVTIHEDSSLIISSILATDAEGDSLSWSLSSDASSGIVNVSGTGSSPTLSYIPNANFFGTDSFSIQVSDGTATDTIAIHVNVTAVNDAPSVSAPNLQTLSVGDTLNLNLSASDVDGDKLTFSFLSKGRSWITLAHSTLSLSGVVPAYEAGQLISLRIGVSDKSITKEVLVQIRINEKENNANSSLNVGTTIVTVINSESEPIESAEIDIPGQQLRYTDSAGNLTLSLPSTLQTRVTLSANGYVARTMTLTAAEPQLNIILERGELILSGSIFTSNAESSFGAKVVASSQLGRMETTALGDGSYQLFLPTGNTTWTVGASLSGYAYELETLATTSGETSKSLDFTLNLDTYFSWKSHQDQSGNVVSLWITAEPPFTEGDESSAIISSDSGTLSDISFQASDASLFLQLTPSGGEKQIQVDLTAQPSLGVTRSLSLPITLAQSGDKKQNLHVFKRLSIVSGTAGIVSLSGLDSSNEDLTGVEIPSFGVSSNVQAIRLERVDENSNGLSSGARVYLIEAYTVDGNTGELIKAGNEDIDEIFLTFSYDPTEWNPTVHSIVYSEDNGTTWNRVAPSDIVSVDSERNTVTIQSTHLSLWSLSSDGGLQGLSGGSTGGGGCLLKP